MMAPIHTPKEIKKMRDSHHMNDPKWALHNAELKFTRAYQNDPDDLETKIWQHIYRENLRLITKPQAEEPKWVIKPIQTLPGLDEITSTILINRGITEDIEDFIKCPLEKIVPKKVGDLALASRIIQKAIKKEIPITIYGDYDADGITGTALMVKALRRIGAKVDYYINTRQSGYSASEAGMREIASRGIPRLVITVDNGVAAHEAIEFARKANMGVIVTDHHEMTEKPNAHALIHAKDFDESLAGVGVAFKLIHFLYDQLNRDDAFDFLDLVAIGTIADLVPLLGENRILTKHGLRKLNNNPEIPITAFKEVLNLKKIRSETIAFNIAPVINAASRVNGTAEQVVELFLETNLDTAKKIVENLVSINENRKKIVEEELIKAEKLLTVYDKVIVLKADFHAGVMGIVAGRLKEKYNRPVIVLAEDGDLLRGSCRSIDDFDIKEVLDRCDGLEHHGGHPKAAGLTLKKANFGIFYKSLMAQAEKLEIKPSVIEVDAKLDDINILTIEAIEDLEPYGMGFPSPVFVYECDATKIMSIKDKHLKIFGDINCIVWNSYEKFIQNKPQRLFLLGAPAINDHDSSLQFVARDFKEGFHEL